MLCGVKVVVLGAVCGCNACCMCLCVVSVGMGNRAGACVVVGGVVGVVALVVLACDG